MTDDDLLLKAKNGNHEAMEKVINQYQKLVYKNSQNFFLRGGEGNDLEQEGYIGLIKAIKAYKPNTEASFATFANLCIRRQLITTIKKANTDKHKIFNDSIIKDSYSENIEKIDYKTLSLCFHTPEELLLGKELLQLLNNYLDKNLSDFEKQVFSHLIQQKTYIEIADILGDTPKRIDNTIQRIKKKVKGYLNNKNEVY